MNPQDHTWWLLSRSAGVVALLLVAASTLMGLLLANGLAKAPQTRKSLTTFHEQTANAGLAAIGLHGVTLLGDAFLHPSLIDLLVPLTIDYKPVFVATGILASGSAASAGGRSTAPRPSCMSWASSTLSARAPTPVRPGCARSCWQQPSRRRRFSGGG
jgi:hypothetical protein